MSDPRLPVEVDAWNDSRWSRVEREMFARLDSGPGAEKVRRRRPLAFMLAGSGLAAAVALVFLLRPAGMLHPDRLRVATTDGTSEVTVGESALTVAPRSLVLVSGDDEHGIDVVLDRGSVTCEVAPRKGRPPFVVDAGGVRVRVVGTKFTVARDDRATTVVVDHGVVEVSASGTVTVMHDGERWPEPPATEPTHPDRDPAAGSMETGAAPSAVPAPSSASSMAAPRPRAAVAQASPSMRPALEDVRATPAAGPSAVPPVSVSPSVPPQPAQDEFETAARIERTRPDDAAVIYRRLAANGTAWAPSALFALARLEADRGHRDAAARLLDDYLARYPRGINADDARALLQRMR